MEDGLAVYERPYDADYPVVCMDESNKQLVGEEHESITMAVGHGEIVDHEYVRNGVADIFVAVEPLTGQRHVRITERRTRNEFAHFIKHMLDEHYPDDVKVPDSQYYGNGPPLTRRTPLDFTLTILLSKGPMSMSVSDLVPRERSADERGCVRSTISWRKDSDGPTASVVEATDMVGKWPGNDSFNPHVMPDVRFPRSPVCIASWTGQQDAIRLSCIDPPSSYPRQIPGNSMNHHLWLFVTLCLLAPAPFIHGETMVDWNAATSVEWKPVSGERLTGAIPSPWIDDSSWAKVSVDYSRVTDGDAVAWRTIVSRRESGRVQISYPIGALGEPAVWRLSLRARSRSNTAIQIGLRDRGAPYAWSWGLRPVLTPRWTDFSYAISLPARNGNVDLMIGVDTLGEVDFSQIRLERYTSDAYRTVVGDEAPGNLLRITRAPLGLPPGWAIEPGRDDETPDVLTDETVAGPGGGPSLRMTSSAECGLWCGVFTAKPSGKHVASVWVRGDATGWLRVLADGRAIGRKELGTGTADAWRRVAVAFDPPVGASVLALQVLSRGTLWLDALQVEAGSEPTAYQPSLPCELAVQADTLDRYGFTTEVRMSYTVLGTPADGAQLAMTAFDAYGRSVAQSVPLLTSTDRHVWSPLADRPYGPLRIEAIIRDKEGKALSPISELVVFRLPRPRHGQEDAPDSPFGIHVGSSPRDLAMAKAVGCNWARLHDVGYPDQATAWQPREAKPGSWNFADAAIARYRSHHLKVLGLLTTAPGWASHLGRNSTNYFDLYYQPKDLDAWRLYCRTMAERYRGVVDHWEVWNEPWMAAFWHTGWDQQKRAWVRSPTAAADYTAITTLAHAAVHEVNPAGLVFGFNASAGHPEWTREVAAAGGLAGCDAVSYHHYESSPQATPADRMRQGWDEAIGPLAVDGTCPRPVWMSEGSPLMQRAGIGMYRHTVPGLPAEDALATADVTARWMVGVLANRVDRFFLYSMHCHSYFKPTAEAVAIVGQDGYLHPSASAYAACAWQLEGQRFKQFSQAVRGVSIAMFEGSAASVAVVVPTAGHAPWTVPEGVEAADVLGNPLASGAVLGDEIVYLRHAGNVQALTAVLGTR